MSLVRWERKLAPLDGIAAVVLWVIGIVILSGPADQPDTGAAPARALAFFKDEEGSILTGTFVFMLGTLFFLWFLGALRTLLSAEGSPTRLTAIAFGAGLVTATSGLLMPATQATGVLNNNNLSPEAAQVYLGLTIAFFYAAELSLAVMLLAAWLVALGTGALPKWLAWASLLVAIWALIPPIGWAALIFAFPLWLIAVSVVLFRSNPLTGRAAGEGLDGIEAR